MDSQLEERLAGKPRISLECTEEVTRYSAHASEIPIPADVPEQTDLQVMVIDRDGATTYLPQIWFDWSRPE